MRVSDDNDALNNIQGANGSIPVLTGGGEKTVNCFAFEAWENTVIASFKDDTGAVVTTGWETITILADKTIYFASKISKFTVTSGGLGQAFKH